MKFGYVTPFSRPEHRIASVEYAHTAEAHGYDGVWVPEAFGSDAFTLLGRIAGHTQRLHLSTGIVNIFSRTPALLAQSFATLDEISGGRARIGLGASGPLVIENWHGLAFDRPLRRMREVVAILRMALAGERVNFEGEFFRLKGFSLLIKPFQPRIPIYLATLKPQAVKVTGEIADGWLPIYLSVDALAQRLAPLDEGARVNGRRASVIDIPMSVLTAVDNDSAVARGLCADHLAYYIGGMGTFYHELMHDIGFGEAADRILACWKSGDRAAARDQVSAAMIRELTICGTPAECVAAIERRRTAGITHILLAPPHGSSVAQVQTTLRALSPRDLGLIGE